jgi:hypothetical protein
MLIHAHPSRMFTRNSETPYKSHASCEQAHSTCPACKGIKTAQRREKNTHARTHARARPHIQQKQILYNDIN